jgi:hypothetical protein
MPGIHVLGCLTQIRRGWLGQAPGHDEKESAYPSGQKGIEFAGWFFGDAFTSAP